MLKNTIKTIKFTYSQNLLYVCKNTLGLFRLRSLQNIYKTPSFFYASRTHGKTTYKNIGGGRAKIATIAAAAGRTHFASKTHIPIFYKNLNISLDVCTFSFRLAL